MNSLPKFSVIVCLLFAFGFLIACNDATKPNERKTHMRLEADIVIEGLAMPVHPGEAKRFLLTAEKAKSDKRFHEIILSDVAIFEQRKNEEGESGREQAQRGLLRFSSERAHFFHNEQRLDLFGKVAFIFQEAKLSTERLTIDFSKGQWRALEEFSLSSKRMRLKGASASGKLWPTFSLHAKKPVAHFD